MNDVKREAKSVKREGLASRFTRYASRLTLYTSRSSLLTSTLLVAFFFGADKLAGLARQVLVAQAFGLTADFDAFNVANNLPDTLVALLSGGALAFVFVPVFTEVLDRQGRARAWELFSHILNLAFTVTAVAALGMALFPLPIARALAPQFSPAQHALVAQLLRLNLIATLLFSISGLLMSALQAHKHFLFPALAPLGYHAGQIFGVLVLQCWGIHGLAYGVILGAALHLAVQIPGLMRYQFQWTPRLTLRDPDVRRVLALLGPRLLTIGFINLVFIFNDRLASPFPEGAVSALYYGWNIMQLPETVIGTAIGTVLLPTLSDLAARGASDELRRLLRRALLVIVALMLPAALMGLALLRPAVGWLFAGRANADFVVSATQFFLLGLVGHSVKEVTARAFYAHKDALTPVFTAGLTFAVFVALGVWLTPRLGFAALALANSVAFTLEAGVMLIILRRRRIL